MSASGPASGSPCRRSDNTLTLLRDRKRTEARVSPTSRDRGWKQYLGQLRFLRRVDRAEILESGRRTQRLDGTRRAIHVQLIAGEDRLLGGPAKTLHPAGAT